MSGIAGIIRKERGLQAGEESREKVRQMVRCMMHEVYYSSAMHFEENLGLAVGWTCFEAEASGRMPAWNGTRDIGLLFIGEDHRDCSKVEDVRPTGDGIGPENLSYLIQAYEKCGVRSLAQIDGWFSGVLIDLRERKVILFNDRYGINRLYFHENEDGFYFASEAKALLRVLPGIRKLDMIGLGELFSCGCVLQNRTIFSGVSLVPGGSAWTWQSDGVSQKASYFTRGTWEQQPVLSDQEYYEKLRDVWTRILPNYFRGAQPMGLSLTGGLDSRLILAYATKAPGALPCYTFGGPYRDCTDVTISRRAAKLCRQPHETIPLTREYFREFSSLAERTTYLTDGALDATGTADLFVQRRAREIGRVRITGLNGGELLRRSIMFKPAPPDSALWDPEFARCVESSSATYAQELKGHRLSFLLFKQAPWHLHGRLALERTQLTVRTPYFSNELAALAYQAPSSSQDAEPVLRLIAEGAPELASLATDRAKRLNSIPFVTKIQSALQEFTFKAEYAYDYGMPQWLAKVDHLMAPLRLERLFLGRHKFYHFRVWFRDEFSSYLQDTLLSARAGSRCYLNRASLERMVRAHVNGIANYTTEIKRALAAELIQQQFLDRSYER